MLTIKKILVPTDFSVAATSAVMHTLHLARIHGAEVHMLHIVEGGYGYDHDRYYPDINPRKAGMMARTALMDAENPVERDYWNEVPLLRVRRYAMNPAPVILDYIQEHEIDLVVMGTQGHRSMDRFLSSGNPRWLLGATADRVLRTASCPVLTIGPRDRDPSRFKRILVPLDFSTHTLETLRYAWSLAEAYDARLDLLHIVEPGEHERGQTDLADQMAYAQAELQALLHATGATSRAGECMVTSGPASEAIIQHVGGNDIDLVVLGSHGKDNNLYAHLGKSAERVVRVAPCPVFTVKVFGKSLLHHSTPTPASGAQQVPEVV